ncbi:MAG: HEAT repeat domain-containing protein [Acidobacteriota bacterium]|nr:HEAT repeat domain-containing protein [Acidobacteriota bacterium]
MDLRRHLKSVVKKLDASVRSSAAEALARIEDEIEISEAAFQEALGDSRLEPLLLADIAWLVGLARLRSVSPTLEKLVSEETPEALLWETTKSLASLGQGAEVMRQLTLTAEDPEKQKIGVYGLGALRDQEAVELLENILLDPRAPVFLRAQSAEALGYIQEMKSVPSLLRASHDAAPELRFWSVFALGQLADPRARQRLAEIAENDHEMVKGWWEVSREAQEALKQIP